MTGDPGPYVDPNGPLVWVPRTVPYLKARRIAGDGGQYGESLHYLGKEDAYLLGFTIDCRCEETCKRRFVDDEDTGDETCRVPAWKFELVER